MDASLNLEGGHPFCFTLNPFVIVIIDIFIYISFFKIEKYNDHSGFIEYLCLSNSYIETQEISLLFNEINGVKHISGFDDYSRFKNELII